MADPKKKLEINVPGDFFVDSTCINCDTCRQLAPQVFGESQGYSFVRAQPKSSDDSRDATRALLSCPTGSIGTAGVNQAKAVMPDFPLHLDGGVYYCGFNSPRSYGGNSYFIEHPDGNWMIDSPKFLPHLVKQFETRGGVDVIFLTHRDDVADAADYARHFGARRIIHQRDLSAMRDSEVVIDGEENIQYAPDFLIVPVPGHTAGHIALLYRNKFLFTGDHLAWDPELHSLDAWPDYCWYSWELQYQSLEKLRDVSFEWVLPGHGQRTQRGAAEMQQHLDALLLRLL